MKDLGEGTKWCTRRSYKDCQADDYMAELGNINIIFNGDKPLVQYAPDFSQVLDVNDDEVTDERLLSLIPPPSLDSSIRTLCDYARLIIKDRWLEAEPYIMQDADWAYYYALEVIGGRWPEAEPIIKQSDSAVVYARDVIGGRWPEAEPIIKQSDSAVAYASDVIKGRWLEIEPYIIEDPTFAYIYARDVIKGRWPEAEPYIIEDPIYAWRYARDVIKDRWLEAEPYIKQNKQMFISYCGHFNISYF